MLALPGCFSGQDSCRKVPCGFLCKLDTVWVPEGSNLGLYAVVAVNTTLTVCAGQFLCLVVVVGDYNDKWTDLVVQLMRLISIQQAVVETSAVLVPSVGQQTGLSLLLMLADLSVLHASSVLSISCPVCFSGVSAPRTVCND